MHCENCDVELTDEEIQAFFNDPTCDSVPLEDDELPICFNCLEEIKNSWGPVYLH